MSLLVILKYVSRIAGILDAAKKIKGAKPVNDAIPLSVNGVRGEFFYGWRPLDDEIDSI